MARRAHGQLEFPAPHTWGGRRRGAGRKPTGPRASASHAKRPEHDARHPVHVTFRAARGTSSLRSECVFARLRDALRDSICAHFRVIHFSAQTDHLHLLVEADDRFALRRGVQGLAVRTARAINRCSNRHGRVWSDRHHAREIATPREMRSGLAYVLLNFRKHLRAPPGVDPRSSGPWFDGWVKPPPRPADPCPVARPQTWLANIGWRHAGGLLDFAEGPGPAARSRR